MKTKPKSITLIDLFAGPGGLGEGFSNCKKNSPFKIALSVEYEKNAHQTLTLRSFYRKLTRHERDKYYYPYITSLDQQTKQLRKKLMLENCSKKWKAAHDETLHKPHALGNPKKWEKIRQNEPLTESDLKPTDDEQNIFNTLHSIKSKNTDPLVVIGGPPCQAYSVNGRNRIKTVKGYSAETDERFFLYQEYLKVLDHGDPDAFVMENVEGILSAKLASGELIFDKIKKELVRPERVRDEQYDIYSLVCPPDEPANEKQGPLYKDNSSYVINASKHGVPQTRKRVILFGIKHKHGHITEFMSPQNSTPTTAELLTGLPVVRSGLSRRSEKVDDSLLNWKSIWEKNRDDLISILTEKSEIEGVAKRNFQKSSKNSNSSSETDPKLTRIEEVKESFSKTIKELKKLRLPENISKTNDGRGSELFCVSEHNSATFSNGFEKKYPELFMWLNRDLYGAANHDTREHMASDLQRYMFSAAWTRAHSRLKSPCPKSKDFPFALSPDHKNWESGVQADRFRTIGAEIIPLTITSHLRKDGHAQIHFDPSQNRSLTVREAARIQTFPDDYYFEGPRGWQYQQVGNAVPAYLAKQIALHVLNILEGKSLI